MGLNGTDPIPEITPTELQQLLDEGQPPVLIDVREPFERDIADLPERGQHRIPMGEVAHRLEELEFDRPIVVYCRTGGRSGRIVKFLRAAGFENVFNLRGGVMGWRDEVDPSLKEY